MAAETDEIESPLHVVDHVSRKGYVICCQARSGSTYLCHLLRSTRRLGLPNELFQDPKLVRRLQGDPAAFDALIDRASTRNGIYGLKLFPAHFEWAARLRWAERLPNLHFVYLEREDLLGQALSLSRAVQTRQFKASDSRAAGASYDPRLIADCIGRLSYGAARWKGYFARNGISPLNLTYEALVRDPQRVVDALADFLDMAPPAIDPAEVRTTMQRDEVTDEWRARFIQDCGDFGYLDGGMLFSRWRGGGMASRLFLGPSASHRRRSQD